MHRARNPQRFSWHLVAVLLLTSIAAAAPALGQTATQGRIRGAVFASNTTPVAGARVEAFSMMEAGGVIDSFLVETETDAQGRYELAFSRPGCYVVRAGAAGYVTQTYGRNDPGDQPCVEVGPGAVVTGIDFHLLAAGSILGHVSDARSGDPIAGAPVMAWPAWRDSSGPTDPPPPIHSIPGPDRGDGWAITDEHGDYRLDGLAEGTYFVFANADGHMMEFYDEAATAEEATPVAVAPSQEVTGIDFTLGTGGCISGIVTSEADGQPIAGAEVWAFPNMSTDPAVGDASHRDGRPGYGVTGRDGRYMLCGLLPGRTFVQVAAEGYLSEFYDNAIRFEDADPVRVPAEGETGGIDFALARGGRIEGQIRDAQDDAPVPGAWVTAWAAWADTTIRPDGTRSNGAWGGTVQADSTGHYVLAGLESGSYIVLADAPPYLTTYYPGTPDAAEATPVVVNAPDATAGIDIEMLRGGSIGGTVRDEVTSQPVAGAWVELYLPYMGGYDDSTGTRPFPGPGAVTGPSGEFRIEGVPSGSYTVFCSAWDQGYEPEFYKDAPSPENATPVVVKAPESTDGIDFTLVRHGPPQGEIAGTITRDSDHEPLPGAVVFAISLSGQAGIATSGTGGGYVIRGLAGDVYYVFAAAAGMIGEFYDDALGWEEAAAITVSGRVAGVDFALGAQSNGPGTIEGRVVDAQGRGLSQVWVYAEPAVSGGRGFTTTGAGGGFTLAGLAPGSYYVKATRVGFESRYYGGSPTLPEADLVQVPAGAVRGVNIVLPGGSSGDPGAKAQLRALGNMPNPFRRSTAIRFSFAAAGAPVMVDIYDVRGRLVRRLAGSTTSEDSQALAWDGLDGTGRPAPAGVYVYRIRAAGRGASGRMLLLD